MSPASVQIWGFPPTVGLEALTSGRSQKCRTVERFRSILCSNTGIVDIASCGYLNRGRSAPIIVTPVAISRIGVGPAQPKAFCQGTKWCWCPNGPRIAVSPRSELRLRRPAESRQVAGGTTLGNPDRGSAVASSSFPKTRNAQTKVPRESPPFEGARFNSPGSQQTTGPAEDPPGNRALPLRGSRRLADVPP